jgi:DNA-binding SARP family transcriptional activator
LGSVAFLWRSRSFLACPELIVLFRILGPLEVRAREGWRGIGAPKWRALLGALLLHPGQVVPTERLVNELWGADAPLGARKLTSGYVLQLRRLIDDPNGQVLVTRSGGYQLLAAQGDLDAGQFEDLVTAGRKALAHDDAAQAADQLAQALALWRGPALADIPPGPLVSAESDRLEELRLTALELRIEADRACGRDTEVVAELRRLTAEYPLRERLWGELMRALDSSGRPAEALEVYAHAREVIADQLGADPGPQLQQLHRHILAGNQAQAARRPPPGRVPPKYGDPQRPLVHRLMYRCSCQPGCGTSSAGRRSWRGCPNCLPRRPAPEARR